MRRYVKPPVQNFNTEPEATPDVQTMTNDALKILNNELIRFKVKSLAGTGLDEKEARVLQGYIKSLVDIRREDRELEKTELAVDAFKNMSNEQLLQEAAKLLIKQPENK